MKTAEISKNTRMVHTDVGVYAVSLQATQSEWQNLINSDSKINWEIYPQTVAGKKIVPYGVNNDLPTVIRNIMDDNNLAPGILEREIGLLYGDGPQLYKIVFDGGQVTKEYVYDKPIWDWLNSWEFRKYIDMALVEYKHLKGVFVKRYLNRGVRIGQPPKITKLKVVPSSDARFLWPERGNSLEDVTHIVTGDFENNCMNTGVTTYPVFDKYNATRSAVAMSYHNSYSFGRKFYSIPGYYGALKWIMRSSDIPDIIKYLTDNGISTAFHIHTPAGYWEQKREKLDKYHPGETDKQIDKRLDDLKDETFKNITQVLTGKKNAGKILETVDFYDENDNLCQWKIESIDQKIKDFIDAQLKIAEKADSATTSGMGLHPSLSNIIVNGTLSAGSQMLYALKLYLLSDTTIPEEIIFEAINEAIQINFPGTELKLGFYHPVVKSEDQVAPEDRTKNKV
nr:hypothetical protein [uncultured Pedobacter sp.]